MLQSIRNSILIFATLIYFTSTKNTFLPFKAGKSLYTSYMTIKETIYLALNSILSFVDSFHNVQFAYSIYIFILTYH